MFAFVVLDVVFLVLNQEIGWEEYLRNDLFYRMGHRSVSQSKNVVIHFALFYFSNANNKAVSVIAFRKSIRSSALIAALLRS